MNDCISLVFARTAAAKDENDAEYLAHIEKEISGVAGRIQEIYSAERVNRELP